MQLISFSFHTLVYKNTRLKTDNHFIRNNRNEKRITGEHGEWCMLYFFQLGGNQSENVMYNITLKLFIIIYIYELYSVYRSSLDKEKYVIPWVGINTYYLMNPSLSKLVLHLSVNKCFFTLNIILKKL